MYMTFDITIPVLNEEETLDQQVRLLHAYIKKQYQDISKWNIVIADNGSTDKTEELAKNLSNIYANIQLVKVPRRGVGLALKTSWTQSNADIVGYMDLDLATDLSHFKAAMDALTIQDFDLVYASRLHRHSKVVNRTFKRELSSRVFNGLLSLPRCKVFRWDVRIQVAKAR
mgnify:CR=1 FL=1